MRKLLARLALAAALFAPTLAMSLTPAQRATLRSYIPVYTCNYLQGRLCGAEQFSTTSVRRTLFDATGKLTFAGNNTLTYSNTFSNAAWTPTSVSVASGVSDPLGGLQAWTLTASGANGTLVQTTTAIPVNFINAIWIKRRTGSGTIQVTDYAGTYTTVTVTASWTQVYVAYAGSAGTGTFGIKIVTNGDAVDVYAATQSAVTYETTPRSGQNGIDDQVITTSAAYLAPRFGYDPITLSPTGFTLEEGRTNLSIRSGALTNAAWTLIRATTSTDGTTFLDGTTATKFTMANSGLSQYITSASAMTTVSGSNYATSWYVNPGTQKFFYVTSSDNSDGTKWASAVFDLSTTANGTASQTGVGAGSGTIASTKKTYLGNGWFRLVLVSNHNTTATLTTLGFAGAATGNSYGVFGVIPATLNGQTAYLAQPQTELGASETSLIPTVSASVARAAEATPLIGAPLNVLRSSSGTVYVEATSESATEYAASPMLINATGSQSPLYAVSDTTFNFWNGAAGGSNATIGSSGAFTTTARVGATWTPTTMALVGNGGTIVSTSAAPFTSSVTSAYLGSSSGSAQFFNGAIRSIAFYGSRLPNSLFQSRSINGAAYQ